MLKRMVLAVCLVATLASVAAAAEKIVVVTDKANKVVAVLKVASDGTDISVTAVDYGVVRLDKSQPPFEPPSGSLAAWVSDRVRAIPDHRRKNETREALAGAYQVLSQQYREGKITQAKLMETRKQVVDSLTGVLGSKKQWEKFDADLLAELNRRKLPPEKIADALTDISVGLAEGKALDPELLAALLEVVMAVISKQPVLPAIIKVIGLLLGDLGG